MGHFKFFKFYLQFLHFMYILLKLFPTKLHSVLHLLLWKGRPLFYFSKSQPFPHRFLVSSVCTFEHLYCFVLLLVEDSFFSPFGAIKSTQSYLGLVCHAITLTVWQQLCANYSSLSVQFISSNFMEQLKCKGTLILFSFF